MKIDKYVSMAHKYTKRYSKMHPDERKYWDRFFRLVRKFRGTINENTPNELLKMVVNKCGKALYNKTLHNGLTLISAYLILREIGVIFDYEKICEICGFEDSFDKEYIDNWNMQVESYRPYGRMLKEEDERVSLDLTISDKWSEDGKNYMELDVKKNGKNTPVKVCAVFTDRGKHLDTVFFDKGEHSAYLTENEVAEELDVSVGDIKKLVEKAKIEAMKEFE